MPYPNSPFDDSFNTAVLTQLSNEISNPNQQTNADLNCTLQWLCAAPQVTSYRVNTLKASLELVRSRLQLHAGSSSVRVQPPSTILVDHLQVNQLEQHSKEVIVDVDCGTAVLRGAHIYAPGILGMLPGTQLGETVSIYADLSGKCLKGYLKKYQDDQKVLLGNGIVRMTRDMLFHDKLSPKGVAVQVTETASGCVSLPNEVIPTGWALLQNIPSILCVEALQPQKGDRVLDMCAAPGHKTTHIAALMENQGELVAIDKTPNKVKMLQQTCETFGACVRIFQADSCKIVVDCLSKPIEAGPPFSPESFNKILLDAPCSALGKRPQLRNRTSEKVIKSYVPLQRKLFRTAVELLEPHGVLVYSTCTITLAENEGVVAWALKTFPLKLVKLPGSLGGSGWTGSGLSAEELAKVQRFGPQCGVDSVGFFLACFLKKKETGGV